MGMTLVINDRKNQDMDGWWLWLENSSAGRKVIRSYCCFFSHGGRSFFISVKPTVSGWMLEQFSCCNFDEEERKIVFFDDLEIGLTSCAYFAYKSTAVDGAVLFGKPGRGEAFLKKINREAVPQFIVQDLDKWIEDFGESGRDIEDIWEAVPVTRRGHLNRTGIEIGEALERDLELEEDEAQGIGEKIRGSGIALEEKFKGLRKGSLGLIIESKVKSLKWELTNDKEKREDILKTLGISVVIVFVLRLTFWSAF